MDAERKQELADEKVHQRKLEEIRAAQPQINVQQQQQQQQSSGHGCLYWLVMIPLMIFVVWIVFCAIVGIATAV